LFGNVYWQKQRKVFELKERQEQKVHRTRERREEKTGRDLLVVDGRRTMTGRDRLARRLYRDPSEQVMMVQTE
jgi:hypothetical protein